MTRVPIRVDVAGANTTAGGGLAPINGARVYLYKFGTTTPITDSVYAAKTGGLPIAKPLTTDSSGVATCWVDTSAGTDVPGDITIVWDDHAGAATPPGSSGTLTYTVLPPASSILYGSAAVFDVTSYGADRTGVSDATTSIQAACTAALTAGGGSVYFPGGTYIISDTLFNYTDSDSGGYRFFGDGMGVSVLKPSPGLGAAINPVFGALGRGSGNNVRATNFTFENFSIAADARLTYAILPIDIWQGKYVRLRNVGFVNLTGMASFTRCYYLTMDSCYFDGCGFAASGYPSVLFQQADEAGTVAGQTQFSSIINSSFIANDAEAVYWSQVDRCKMIGNFFDTSTSQSTSLITLVDVTNSTFIANHTIAGADDNIRVTSLGSSAGNTFLANHFDGALGGTAGTGYGLNVSTENSVQTQAQQVAEANQFAVQSSNALGDISLNGTGTDTNILGPTNRSPSGPAFFGRSPTPLWLPSTEAVVSTATPDASAASFFLYQVTGATLAINAPTHPVKGQTITFRIYNNHGSGITTTWNAIFKQPAWSDPATGKYKTVSFTYDSAGPFWWVNGAPSGDI